MSSFIKDLIKSKLKNISAEELLYQSKQYGFSISESEAQEIVTYLNKSSIDPFNTLDREKMFNELSQITNPATAMHAQNLFQELISTYGFEHLFE